MNKLPMIIALCVAIVGLIINWTMADNNKKNKVISACFGYVIGSLLVEFVL